MRSAAAADAFGVDLDRDAAAILRDAQEDAGGPVSYLSQTGQGDYLAVPHWHCVAVALSPPDEGVVCLAVPGDADEDPESVVVAAAAFPTKARRSETQTPSCP